MSEIINPNMGNQIEFNPDKFLLLKKSVRMAKEKNVQDFYFDGVLLLTEYGEYLLEYLTPIFEEDVAKDKDKQKRRRS